jgi:hypothetical protein
MDGPDPIAQLDQAIAEMRPIARMLFGHYNALREAGFSDAVALRLVEVQATEWWRATLSKSDATAQDD